MSIQSEPINEAEEKQMVSRQVRRAMPQMSAEEVASLENRSALVRKGIIPQDSRDLILYSIKYHPLCGGKVSGIPEELKYLPVDGLTSALINEMNIEELDEMVNYVLNDRCYESKYEGFDHWNMPNPEKMRAFINLRINSAGETVEYANGICTSCGTTKLFTKMSILDFEEVELKPEYKEPFALKYQVGGGKDKKEIKVAVRLIQSGDLKKAKDLLNKDKALISKFFPNVGNDKKEIIIQILEYANTILLHDGKKITFEDAIQLCTENADLINAITTFNEYFSFGMKLEKKDLCENLECSSRKGESQTTFDASPRGSVPGPTATETTFIIPIQPSLFYSNISSAQERSSKYFDVNP